MMNLVRIIVVGGSLALLSGAVACADFSRGPRAVEDDPTDPGDDNDNDNTGGGDTLSFEADVYGLLVSGCESCHSSAGAASSTGYIISGDVDSDYMNTLMFIDESSPGTSRLLTKGAGQSHGGGGIYGTDSQEFALMIAWIQDGALP